MAITTQSPVLTTGMKVVRDTDSDATSEDNINSGAATLYLVEIANPNASAVYTKLYNSTGPTVGVTAPDMAIPCAASSTVRLAIPKGVAFATGISFATVTDGGGTAGTTNPTSDVTVALVIV